MEVKERKIVRWESRARMQENICVRVEGRHFVIYELVFYSDWLSVCRNTEVVG